MTGSGRLSADNAAAIYDNPNLKKRNVPIQLRQSGDNGDEGIDAKGSRLLIDCRLRKGPYWHLSQEQGAWCYQVYNHVYHPRAYIRPEDGGLMKEYEYLTEHVTMWNVAVERQIQVKGPDAEKFVDLVVTRRASKCPTGKCRYVILCNADGGIINDPVLLRPEDDEFWFSLADSDVGLYLKGVNATGKFDVTIREIDVAPVQIQGPKSTALMRDLFGDDVADMPYYDLRKAQISGCPVVISCSGFSAEAGYEIYLRDATKNAEKMWDTVLEAGKKHNIRVIAPGHHRRIEAGILSWGQDIDEEMNPYEVGFGWQVDLTKDDFIGKAALARIQKEGVTHKLVGVRMGGKPITWYPADFYHVHDGDELVGYITSAWYSPTQGCNIGFAFVPVRYAEIGTQLSVTLPKTYADAPVDAEVAQTPFKKPENPGTGLLKTGSKLET